MRSPGPIRRSGARPVVRRLPPAPAPDQPELKPSGSSGHLGVEIGLIAAFSFAFSGAINWWMFDRRWGIDYFSVATTQDVVMNGFLISASVITASLLVSVLVWLTMPVLSLAIATAWNTVFPRRAVTTWSIFFGGVKPTFHLFVTAFRGTLLVSLVLMVISFWIELNRTDFYVFGTGMSVSRMSKLPDGCHDAPILWMGSEAAIFECGDDVRVERDFDRLQIYGKKVPQQGIGNTPGGGNPGVEKKGE